MAENVFFFSTAWAGLADGTEVNVEGGKAIIGTDAFFLYDDAKTAAGEEGVVKSPDAFYNFGWKTTEIDEDEKPVDVPFPDGTEVEITCASGTFITKIGDANIKAFGTLAKAQKAAGQNWTLNLVGGEWVTNSRNNWHYLDTRVVNTRITGSTNGAIISIFNGAVSDTSINDTFTVGEGSYISTVGLNGNIGGSTFGSATIAVVDGGSIGTVLPVGYTGFVDGAINIIVKDGGRVNRVHGSTTGGRIDGTITVTVGEEGYIKELMIAPGSNGTMTLNGTIQVDFEGGTVNSLTMSDGGSRILDKGETGKYFVTAKSGVSYVNALGNAPIDNITINVGATLVFGNSVSSNYGGVITIDATDCDASEGRYVLIQNTQPIDQEKHNITVINPLAGYNLAFDGTKLVYEAEPVYFSAAWRDLADGTEVQAKGKTLTIGTDAFGSYQAAADAGEKNILSLDVYLDNTWPASGTVDVMGYKATLGVDAFNTVANAVAAAKKQSDGVLHVVGGDYPTTGSTTSVVAFDGVKTVIENTTFGSLFAGSTGAACPTTDVTLRNSIVKDAVIAGRYVGIDFAKTTIIDSVVSTVYGTALSVTDNALVEVTGSTIGFITTSTSAAGNFTVNVTGSTITAALAAAGAQNASNTSGDSVITLNDADVAKLYGNRGSDGSNIKDAYVVGNALVHVTGGETSTVGYFYFGDRSGGVSASKTLMIDVGSTLSVTGNNSSFGDATITVNAATCDGTKGSYLLLSSAAGHANVTVNVIDAKTGYEYSWIGNNLYYAQKPVYFTMLWKGLADGTQVQYGDQTLTIGTDAFGSYAKAKETGAANIVSVDVYVNSSWTKDSDIEIDGYKATFGGDAFAKFADGVASAKNFGGVLRVEGGEYASLTDWSTNKVFVTDATVTGGCRAGNTCASGKTKEITFTNSHLQELLASTTSGDAGMNNYKGSLVYNLVESTATNVGFSNRDWGAGVDGNSANNMENIAFSLTDSTVTNVGNNFTHSNLWVSAKSFDINLNGSTVTNALSGGRITLATEGGMASVDGGEAVAVTGLLRNVGGSRTIGEDGTITYTGGTTWFNNVSTNGTVVVTGGVTNLKSVNVTGGEKSYAKTISDMEAINITVGSTLSVGTLGAGAVITIDAADCDYTEGRYFLLDAGNKFTNAYSVINDDPSKGYKIVRNGNSLYYQAPPVYFSTLWADKSAGETVTFGSETLTIGTDAFQSYDVVPAGKKSVAMSADTYLNSNYNATDPIMIGDYQATFNGDAYASAQSAFERASDTGKGGKLFVTGGAYGSLEGMDGIENIDIADIKVTNSLVVMKAGGTIEKINVECRNSETGNGFVVVSAGTVTGDVSVNIADSQLSTTGVSSACYMVVRGGAVVNGDLHVTVTDSLLKRGLYVTDIAGESIGVINGSVDIALAGATVVRKGIVNDGTVNGTVTVTIAADSTVSAIATGSKVIVNEGVTLFYGEKSVGEWKDEYFTALDSVENNGTIIINTAIAQNAYLTVVADNAKLTGDGEIVSEVGNVIFTADAYNPGTYAAAKQNDVYINSTWAMLEEIGFLHFFSEVDFDPSTQKRLYGVSAFKSVDDAKSMMAEDAVVHVTGKVEGELIGTGKVTFTGSTVSGNVYAQGELTVSGGTANIFSSLIGGGKGSTVVGESSVTIDTDKVTGKVIVGSSYLTEDASLDGTSTVVVNGGSFSYALIGGALVNDGVSVDGYLFTDVTLAGGTVKVLGGGCYLQGAGSAVISGESNVTISGGVVDKHVFGGSFANKMEYATTDAISLDGSINVTIDTTNAPVVIGGNLVAGNYGTGSVSGDTTLTFKGSGDDLTIGGHITGDCSGGSDGEFGRFVAGTRKLAFDGFNGSLGTEGTKLAGFDAVALNGGDVEIASYGMLFSVSDWSITDGTLTWLDGVNDFSGDKLSLVSSSDIGDEGWTVFELGKAGLATGWDQFTLDEDGDAKISLSINGVEDIAVWDEEKKAYIATDYKFYKEDNALKVAKLA